MGSLNMKTNNKVKHEEPICKFWNINGQNKYNPKLLRGKSILQSINFECIQDMTPMALLRQSISSVEPNSMALCAKRI